MTSPLEVVFIGLAILTGASALLAVTSPQVSHCALWLFVSLLSLAGVYLVLGAEIVALVQLLVYVGAVVVVVLFALMMTRSPDRATRLLDAPPGQRLAGAVGGIGVAVVLAGTLTYALGDDTVTVQQGQGNPAAIGSAVFAGWLLPFELLSVLLLAALVAALAVSRTDDESPAGTAGTARTPGTAGTDVAGPELDDDLEPTGDPDLAAPLDRAG